MPSKFECSYCRRPIKQWYGQCRPCADFYNLYRCDECNRRISPRKGLCRKCAGKKRSEDSKELIELAGTLPVTSLVYRRLNKKSEEEIPKSLSYRLSVASFHISMLVYFIIVVSYAFSPVPNPSVPGIDDAGLW